MSGTALITGANRGLGLALVGAFADAGWRVHACARMPEKARALKNVEGDVVRHRLNVTDALQLSALARELEDEALDVLVNNAAIDGPRAGLGRGADPDWLQVFNVNTLAPMRVVSTFADHLEAAPNPRAVNISSRLGSIGETTAGGAHLFRASKAALNMLTRCQAIDLGPRGISVVALHPDRAATEVSPESERLSPEASAQRALATIAELGLAASGGFYTCDGEPIPW